MRYWEIDATRGIAVLMMIVYHFLFDMFYSSYRSFYWFAILTASLFIVVSGISLSISYSRGAKFKKFLNRGLKLLILGGVITLMSYLFLDSGFILFGILHFFGVSSILIYPFLKHSKNPTMMLLGVVVAIVGFWFLSMTVDVEYLFWLGLLPARFYTFDYFPIFPWFGLMLIGVFMGSQLYPDGKRIFKARKIDNVLSRALQFFGRNSLVIYFIHQPIILLLLSVFWRTEVLSLINI
jgi:uncharacterized membrane protein